MRFSFVLIVNGLIFFTGVAPVAHAGDSPHERATLKDIHGVLIVIKDAKGGAKKIGLTEDQVQTDVEIKLRLAGLNILSEKEWFQEKGMPYLSVTVQIFGESDKCPAYHISVKFIQKVFLDRNLHIRTHAATWLVSARGTGGKEDVRAAVKDLADRFVNAYLSVNPK